MGMFCLCKKVGFFLRLCESIDRKIDGCIYIYVKDIKKTIYIYIMYNCNCGYICGNKDENRVNKVNKESNI